MSLHIQYIDTPLGRMKAGATDEGICLFDFEYRRMIDAIMKRIFTGLGSHEYVEAPHPHIDTLKHQITEYFNGTRKEFDLPLHLIGTDFQKRVWNGLLQIPYSETRSYEQQSIFLGDPKAIRAVAGANGENGLAIIVPCHRVIGKNGSLTGYGGGLPKKKWLLEHEIKHSGKTNQINLF
jgi:AraC family transcriptional regulator of adaptative response/methylated-DNA-[protein]-cysteine methyltransferase